jgi:crotonobetainyl-CoA:carnitine CoA-transferase CaiB-like acyl-CoA transferase
MTAAVPEQDGAAPGPLGGVRVLDLSLLLPGPFATQMLADLGADVIKVEPPRGDATRTQRPNDLFPIANRNKRSVSLDLKDEVSRAACLRIAATSDVVIEGFRPGVVDRLGMSYEDVRRVRSDIIYCSISGHGQNGPLRDRPGHDGTYLAISGALSYSGHWLEPPRRSGIPVGDLGSSAFAVISILAALHERAITGRGAYLDVAMADAATALATFRAGSRLDLAASERGHLLPTNDLFVASDGTVIAIAAVEEHFWDGLRRVISAHEPAILDQRFDDHEGRRVHGDELKKMLDAVIATRPGAEWMEAFADHDVPAQPVLTVPEALETGQARARGLVVESGDQRHYGFPVLRDGRPMGRLRTTAPGLGEHTAEILAEVGCAEDQIEHALARASQHRETPTPSRGRGHAD